MFLVNVLPKTLLFDGCMLQQLFSNTFLLTHPKELGNNNQQLHRKSQLKSNKEQNIKLVYLFFFYIGITKLYWICHFVKSVQIRIFFWSFFSCIRTEYRKTRNKKTSVFGHFSRCVSVHCENFKKLENCLQVGPSETAVMFTISYLVHNKWMKRQRKIISHSLIM